MAADSLFHDLLRTARDYSVSFLATRARFAVHELSDLRAGIPDAATRKNFLVV